MVAATDPQIKAIVLMAGSGKRGDQISMDQLNDALERATGMSVEDKEKQRAQQNEIIQSVETSGELAKYPAQVRYPWVNAFWTNDPMHTFHKARQPLLIPALASYLFTLDVLRCSRRVVPARNRRSSDSCLIAR